ncbi:3-hydroxybutyrate dehydrogenase [Alicyclobacillus cycloheptanicus]|jgi:3-hydroxybutyrate dehydrogenase|uniref:3-hydroxybutyrate dehydrogenase n=1 Tax=Alicyclobacillus cycloheptanicus TaxID=1457 RepID=A0ABT9XI15_9BACL|nr:3-hydroxybutyrate dehydrogenase [Alicyclobacillus cycloheptanicus]MDQ0189954.1 3-hydroxybutyrate dehydrogenase [Alicyclobacillus cycloheptanicus]WDM02150.1 3-hydroxybutyrate dehydrogenase [Alicyclobacillus cycloheptanicus]
MGQKWLDGKTAVITGAASGIGFAIAERFAQQGANVIVSDIREQAAMDSARVLAERGYTAVGRAVNAAAEEDLQALVDFALQAFGTVEIWVNNAGMQHVANVEEFPVPTYRRMIDLMLVGPFIATKHIFPVMKRHQYGRILNIASINGLIGFAGKAAYNSAKHGVIGLTKVAALEGAGFGITVNALCPGYVDTPLVRNQLADLARVRGISPEQVLEEVIYPLVPQRRLLEPAEVADYALFLASHHGRSITGQAVVIDGGYVAQ